MPDDRDLHSAQPRGWGDAFATLPLETPDSGGWQRIERALPRRRPLHRPAWAAALAAALALAAVLPTWISGQAERIEAAPVAEAGTAASPPGAARSPAIDSQPEPIFPDRGVRRDVGTSVIAAADPPPATASTNPSRRPDRVRDRATNARPKPGTIRPAPDAARADSDMPRIGQAVAATEPAPAAELDRLELNSLYAESAQLEALLAMARDERVSSGTAAALASEFDAQVASIDATLIQPGVTPQQRTALWRDRVDALRQVAAFESTQRMLAAQGERYDAMLVSVD